MSGGTLVATRDGMLFRCEVDRSTAQGRWVFVSRDGIRYTGPAYGHEDSLARLRELVTGWWSSRRAFDRAD